jgi:hypothetical protein
MNAAHRSELDTVPIPVEDGAMVRARVVRVPTGWRVAWARDAGLREEPFGPIYVAPRDATAASRYINARGAL